MIVGEYMNSKGLTLPEILGVLIILSVILVIAVPIVFTAINSSRESSYNILVNNIEMAASNYVTENSEQFFGLNTFDITLWIVNTFLDSFYPKAFKCLITYN